MVKLVYDYLKIHNTIPSDDQEPKDDRYKIFS